MKNTTKTRQWKTNKTNANNANSANSTSNAREINNDNGANNYNGDIERVAFLRLVENASRGDFEAISTLCSEIAKDVLFRSTRILNNSSDAEDVAQETMLRVCKNIRQLKDPRAFRKWLSSILLNEARRQMMQNARQHNIVYLDDELESAPEENEDFLPEAYTENEENRRAVIAAIDELPVRQREAIVLHYYDRLSVTETAEVMGIPQPSVSLYLKHARNKIKIELESQAQRARGFARGFAFMPIGAALTHALATESAVFTPATSVWLPNVLAKCFESAQIVAAEGSAAASAAEGSASARSIKDSSAITASVKTGLITASSIFAAAAIAFTVAFLAPKNNRVIPKEPANAVGEIVFSGDNADLPYLNPDKAESVTDSSHGELSVLDWKITEIESEEAIYSGKNEFDNSVFSQMRAEGKNGEYMLLFSLEDANGDTYSLGHNFIIHSGLG